MARFKKLIIRTVWAGCFAFFAAAPSYALIPVLDSGTLMQCLLNNVQVLKEINLVEKIKATEGRINKTFGEAKSNFFNFLEKGIHNGDGNEENGEYFGYDLGSINGKLCLIEAFVMNEEDAETYSQMFEVEISVNDILYVDMESAIGVSLEITETDATSGWIRFSELVTIEYKNLTKDSVTLIPYEDGAALIDEAIECRTPEGWGLKVNNYIDITSALQ